MKVIDEIIKNDSTLYDLFIKKNEYTIKRPDRYRDNQFTNSNNLFFPKISEYLYKESFSEYPDGKKFALCLTHDVDEVFPSIFKNIKYFNYILNEKRIKEISNVILWRKNKYELMENTFKRILQLENNYNAKSTFYFLTTNHDPKRYRYNIQHLTNILNVILENESEIGLHGGYYSYNNLEEIIQQKNILEKVIGKKIIGYRNHYLRFEVPKTWELLYKAGFKHDSTYGFNDVVGFRNGLCHPFVPFDINTKKHIPIIEIPLIIMDIALLKMADNFQEAWVITKHFINIIEKFNGVLTILWHNDDFSFYQDKNWVKLYIKILDMCYRKNAWITSANEIHRWWKNSN